MWWEVFKMLFQAFVAGVGAWLGYFGITRHKMVAVAKDIKLVSQEIKMLREANDSKDRSLQLQLEQFNIQTAEYHLDKKIMDIKIAEQAMLIDSQNKTIEGMRIWLRETEKRMSALEKNVVQITDLLVIVNTDT
jgi:hypothetical protein